MANRRSLATTATLTGILAAGLACRASIDAFGPSAEPAQRAADSAFAGFAYRFHNVERDETFDRARRLMGRYALIPSRLYADTSLWSVVSPKDSSRSLFVHAWYDSARYRFAAVPTFPPPPDEVGEERHSIRLEWKGGGDFLWQTSVDHAVGHATPAQIAAAIVATLTAAEDRSADQALADARTTFARSARHLSQIFSLDSLRTVSPGDGSTTVTLGFTFRPDRLGERYPFLARYVDRFIMPASYRVRLTGVPGTTYLDVLGHKGMVVARLRSRDHRLVSLEDPGAAMPDSMTLHAEFDTKYRLFRVGFSRLQAAFTIERGPHHRGWLFRFRREPEWGFPLFADRLIRGSLRHPFAGRGIEFLLAVRSDRGEQTQSVRTTRVAVAESAIMRWLGSLGASAFGEFSGRTELEENLFLYELFAALREDVGGS